MKKVGRFGKSGGLSEGGSFAKSRKKSSDGRWGWSMLDRSSPYSTQNEGSSTCLSCVLLSIGRSYNSVFVLSRGFPKFVNRRNGG